MNALLVYIFAGSIAFWRLVYMTTFAQNKLKYRIAMIFYRNSSVGLALK
jgi:hypothetical protein